MVSQAKVRVLMLDPNFPTKAESIADYRDVEEGGVKGEIRADVEAFERTVGDNPSIDHTRFEIRRMR